MARQPIVDRAVKVQAYEILFRRDSTSGGAGPMSENDSLIAMVRTLIEIGLDQLAGPHLAFVNVPTNLLNHPAVELFPKERVVLEILETVEPTPENLEIVASLAEQGFAIALDDFVFGSPQEAFLPYAKVVKVDVQANDWITLPDRVRELKERGLRVLAEKVETHEIFQCCLEMGFDSFQGYFFAKPTVVSGRTIPPSQAVLLNLMVKIRRVGVHVEELEQIVTSDVSLTYRLLRLVNSACIAVPRKVDSVKTALMFLGTARVSALVSLLAMAGMGDKPTELVSIAMIRAKTCEAMARAQGLPNPEQYFTTGLLSVLDAMLDMPMPEIINQMPLETDIADALSNPQSETLLAAALHAIQMFESGRFDESDSMLAPGLSVADPYLEGVRFASEVLAAISSQAMAA